MIGRASGSETFPRFLPHAPSSNAQPGRISRFRGDLCLRHGIVITCVYVSAHEAQSGDSPLLQNVRAEGVAL